MRFIGNNRNGRAKKSRQKQKRWNENVSRETFYLQTDSKERLIGNILLDKMDWEKRWVAFDRILRNRFHSDLTDKQQGWTIAEVSVWST